MTDDKDALTKVEMRLGEIKEILQETRKNEVYLPAIIFAGTLGFSFFIQGMAFGVEKGNAYARPLIIVGAFFISLGLILGLRASKTFQLKIKQCLMRSQDKGTKGAKQDDAVILQKTEVKGMEEGKQTVRQEIKGEKVTLSDWITFLSSESSPGIGNIFSLGTLLVAWIGIMAAVWVTTSTYHLKTVTIIILVYTFLVALFGYVLMKHFGLWDREARAREAHKLLDCIMSEKLKDPSHIKELWELSQTERKAASQEQTPKVAML